MYRLQDYLNSSICGCCGSRYLGNTKDVKRYSSSKGITVYLGEAKQFESAITSRKTIQTKNGPITIQARKA